MKNKNGCLNIALGKGVYGEFARQSIFMGAVYNMLNTITTGTGDLYGKESCKRKESYNG